MGRVIQILEAQYLRSCLPVPQPEGQENIRALQHAARAEMSRTIKGGYAPNSGANKNRAA